MKTFVKFFDHAVGKTIEMLSLEDFGNSLYVIFTDGTYSVLKARSGAYDEDGPDIHAPEKFDVREVWAFAATRLKIMTKEEFNELGRKEEERLRELNDRNERAQYERLKAKFEPTTK